MIKTFNTYVSSYESLIQEMETFQESLNFEIQRVDPGGDLLMHDSIWDHRCSYMSLSDSEICNYNDYSDCIEIDFSYDVPYDNDVEYFTFRFYKHWEHLTIGEIVKDIFDKSYKLYDAERIQEIARLEKSLESLRSCVKE